MFSVIFLSGGDHVFGYRRHSFNSALAQLSILRANPGNLEALLCLQEVLIAEITLAETRVQETKRQAARSEGKRSLYLAARVKALQQSIYYWKMIGDAVAFLYLDRFALKHVYYNTDNPYPRNDAGFLTGSRGFDLEVKIARNLIQSGYPCLLTDLTNTVRHGDICLLHGSDPTLIEVKSSKDKSRRARRQHRNLRKLAQFYATDELDGLRGFRDLRRLSTRTECVTFETAFNDCIATAYEKGYSVVSPENGTCYIAITKTNKPMHDVLRETDTREPWLFFLNETKSNQAWAPYYPFTLLMTNARAVYDFILGRLLIVVMLDVEVIKKRLREMGYVPEFCPDSECALRGKKIGTEEEVGISQHLLLRAAFEAVSLKWLIQASLDGLEQAAGLLSDRRH